VNAKTKLNPLLKKIADIQRMERGKLCPMRQGASYNHQTWEKGRNIVRYVPQKKIRDLQKAIQGYQLFLKLTQNYADQIIQRTRETPTAKTSFPSALKIKKRPKRS